MSHPLPISFNESLAQLALQAQTSAQHVLQRGKQQKEHYLKQRADQAITVFEALLTTEIDPELREDLHLTYLAHHESQGLVTPEAVFEFANATWSIKQSFPQRSAYPWQWEIRATKGRGSYAYVVNPTAAQPLALRLTLLTTIAGRLEHLHAEEQQAAERTRQRVQQALEEEALVVEQNTLRAERIAQADQEHGRLRLQLDELKQQTEASLWQWPEGTALHLYGLTYITGIVRADEEEDVIEKAHAWTSNDQLDSQGYIRLEETCTSWGVYKAKEVKLSPSIHMPIWERITVRSVSELPSTLHKEIEVSIPRVVSRTNTDLDTKARLIEIAEDDFDFEEHAYSESVGYVPLLWIRQLVEGTEK